MVRGENIFVIKQYLKVIIKTVKKWERKNHYYYGKLKFKGEYLNGKKQNGKGYDKDNKHIIYELKDGNGSYKEFDVFDVLMFEGEYKKGERNGKGKEFLGEKVKN